MNNNSHTLTTTTTNNVTTPSTTTTTTFTTSHANEEEALIKEVLVASYWGLMPLVVVVGVAVNALGLYLLNRPRMRAFPATSYLKLLLSLDVAVLMVTFTTIFTLNGCHLQSYGEALFFVHPLFTVFYGLQTLCHYVAVWLCYDRFLALWFFSRFQQTQQPRVMKVRIIITALFCAFVNLRHFFNVTVVCVTDMGVVEAINHRENCDKGTWVILDSLHQLERREVWQSVAWVVRGLLVIVMPVLLVVVLNSGIMVGLMRRRLQNISATTRTRDQTYSSIYITLAISITSITTAIPTVVHAMLFAKNIKYCHGSFREEIFRAFANLLLVGEHLTHILFLAINQTFRDELRVLIHNTRKSLISSLTGMAPAICPSCWQSPKMHNTMTTSNGRTRLSGSDEVPIVVVLTSKEQPDGGECVKLPTQAPMITIAEAKQDKNMK